MSRRVSIPKIDPRTASDLLFQLRAMAPHYTIEWPARDEDDPGVALLKIFSFIAEGVISRLNRAPERNFLAFLDMLGIRLLPKTPASAPVRFVVAPGTEDEFLIPKGAQVSAPPAAGRPDEFPFETKENLWAIPALLTALIAVDPENDRIYKPPPGFLTLTLSASELPPMTITAFSAAGSKSLQLDPPGLLQEGDFIRIELPLSRFGSDAECVPALGPDQGRVFDHLVVAEPKGQLVILKEPLARDYVEGTLVRKLTRFELFEGKNFQEHVLYLAHGQYFDVKSEARIELALEHAPGSASNLQPLNIAWEFFGVTEELKEERWHPFEVELDGSAGLSRDGNVVLIKPPGEIKETEINGNESRWIRARLIDPIPAILAPRLADIESITLKVSLREEESSGGKGLSADQAFHNDTPLPVNLEFHPFGLEPRILDRFYIASAEAFSKPGAEVTLDVELDFTDLLAAPAAIFQGGEIRAFARGAAGRLVEFQIDTTTPPPRALRVENHRTPLDTRITSESIPAVISSQGRVGLFVKGGNNRIHLRSIAGDDPAGWQWIDLQAPAGELAFDPSVALLPDGKWQVYAVADNKVYSKVVNPLSPDTQTDWTPYPDDFMAASTPFALSVRTGNASAIWVVVIDAQGKTWVFNGNTDKWEDMTPKEQGAVLEEYLAWQPTSKDKRSNPRPYAFSYADSQVRIFLRNKDSELVVFDTQGNREPPGSPDGVKLDSNPYVSGSSWGAHIFVRGTDNQLWEFDPDARQWRQHLNTQGFNLASDPFILSYSSGTGDINDSISVLSTSDKNSLLELPIRVDDGLLRAGPRDILLLDAAGPELSTGKTFFVQIVAGPGKGAVRKILSDLSAGRFAVLETPLAAIATSETEYRLFEQKEEGDIQDADDDTVKLKAGTTAEARNYVFARDQLREIDSLQGETATLTQEWDAGNVPVNGDKYVLLELAPLDSYTAQEGSARRAVLAANASDTLDQYKGRFFKVVSGEGESPVVRQIVRYYAVTKNIVLDEDFDQTPARGSAYRIMGGIWESYRDPYQTELRPELSWEYWNGSGWVVLPEVDDKTQNFLLPEKVRFELPEDIARTEVGGQENYWIRARIVGGDYGREQFFFDEQKKQLEIRKDPIQPPLINKLSIYYEMIGREYPQFCLAFNNLGYLDQTAANITPDKHFRPYETLPDEQKSLYFGFDKEFEGGPVRLYLAAGEIPVDDRNKPRLVWEIASGNGWKAMAADDRTDAFTRPEIVTWTVPGEFQRRQQFGEASYWVRARLTEGIWNASPLLSGVFINTVEAIQARTVLNEILGSSTSARNERFRFRQLPVLEGEVVRVREVLTDEERKQLISEEGEDAVLDVRDQEGRVLETWVRWKEAPEFFDSGPVSRHYRLDRASGELQLGDGVHGRIPPAGGDNIRAFSYQAGGGALGNVAAGEINAPVTAVAGVESVINPAPAGGGSEAATAKEMIEIGPAQVSHRDRAVTPDDFERLAREASREVRKARCLPNRNAAGRPETGWTSVYIIPDSMDAQPMPSLELRRAVHRYLASRSDVTLVDQDHIFVGPPVYVPVSLDVTVYARSLDVVGAAELKVRERLAQFLHPLTGGPAGEGWDFGRDLAASDLYSLLEDIEEVDHVGPLRLRFGETESEEQVEVNPDALLASGPHTIRMTVANGE